jgi:HEAT repeat protein
MRQLSLASAVFLALTEAALAHGGTYRRSAPDGDTCTPARAPVLTGSTTGGRSSGGTARTNRFGPEYVQSWEWWWENNSGPWLEERAKLMRELATPYATTANGKGRTGSLQLATLIKDQIRAAATPALLSGLTDPYFDARAASVIALGKIVDRSMPESDEARRAMRELLADPERETGEAACVALGLLGDKADAPDLVLLMKDQPSARWLAGASAKRVLPRQRAFAAVGAGLLGMRNHLSDVVPAEISECAKNEAQQEIRVLAAIALASMRSRAELPELKKIAMNVDADPITRAHAVVALAKLSDQSFGGWLIRAGLADQSNDVQRSSVIAIGLLATHEDEKTVDVLIRRAQFAGDRPVRNLALVALGRIGGPTACRFLISKLESSQSHDRTFAALGLGLSATKPNGRRTEAGEALSRAWTNVKDELDRGAIAIALGLARYEPAALALTDSLKTARSPVLKGHLATALGLLGARGAAPFIRVVANDPSDPEAQGKARAALGLLGDPGDVGVLLEAIRQPGADLSAIGGAAVGLGYLGFKEAVPSLCEMLVKREQSKDLTRAFAAVALGCLGDKDPAPLLTTMRADANYLAATDSFRELARIY